MTPTAVRLNLLGAATLAALLAEGWTLAAVVAGALAIACRGTLTPRKRLFGPPFLVFSGLTILLGAFLFAPEGGALPSPAGALVGLSIVARAAIILAMARWVAEGATAFEMARLGERVGLRWLGFALGVAINALPDLEASARRTWDAMRMRGGFRRRKAHALRLFAVATLTNALMRADAQADAATARGLGLQAPRPQGVRWTGADWALVVGGWAGALLVAVL